MSVKISKRYKNWLYLVLSVSWVSGVVFFILNNFYVIEGEFGVEKHPAQFLFLKIHGAAAFLMMITYGFFFGSHVKLSWRVKPVRKFGIILMSIPALLALSAYILYYVSSDWLHGMVAYFHLSLGIPFPIILVIHILLGRNKRLVNNY
ncbi:MAG: hypothetical protein ISQ34_00495 [Rickettsiales bacterium]|nr:hypothetical protein [Rickettsiales bacterium]